LMTKHRRPRIDVDLADLHKLREIEIKWALQAGINVTVFTGTEACTRTATDCCIQCVTGTPPNTDTEMDCTVEDVCDDEGDGPVSYYVSQMK